MNTVCICGHKDNRHADRNDGTVIGEWGVGECELCRCQKFEKKIKKTLNHWPESEDHMGISVPVKKLPDCPECKEDELGMLNKDFIMCYLCNARYWHKTEGYEIE